MSSKKLKVATVFSGIGAFEHALKRMNIPHEIIFACDNGDVDIFGKKIEPLYETIEKELKECEILLKTLQTPFKAITFADDKSKKQKKEELKEFNKEINTELKTFNSKLSAIGKSKEKSNYKELAELLGMTFEKVNTYKVELELLSITDKDISVMYKKRKEYIDSLYKKKEKQNKVKQSYFANYEITDDNFHWNVKLLDGNQYKNEVDIFVGGSPCQAFSISGKRRGFEDTRGTLFYEYARLIKEIQPKAFIYENVKGMLNHDKGNTWKTIQAAFDELGYNYSFKLMNSKDYGIPQSRPRIFVVGFRKDLDLKKEFEFPESFELKHKMQDFLMDNVSGRFYLRAPQVNFITNEMRLNKKYTQIDGEVALCQKKCQQYNLFGDFVFVEENKDMEKTMEELDKYFLSDKVEKYVMSTGTKGFQVKPKIDNEIASTLTKTMHKMHRASIDNYVTTDGRLRKLTPRECLRLMGFCDSFKIEVSDTAAYMQSGNSIVVDVLMFIMSSILDSYDFELDLKEIQRPIPNMIEKIFEKQEDGSYIEIEEETK